MKDEINTNVTVSKENEGKDRNILNQHRKN